MQDSYKIGREFSELFSRFEYALKRLGFLRNRSDAQADWNKYARELGSEFFEHVKQTKLADTLIDNPPRKLMKEGLMWEPNNPEPLKDVIELFVFGVCRVRNSLFHGEKFASNQEQWERDTKLVSDALAVLRAAQQRVPEVAKLIVKR